MVETMTWRQMMLPMMVQRPVKLLRKASNRAMNKSCLCDVRLDLGCPACKEEIPTNPTRLGNLN